MSDNPIEEVNSLGVEAELDRIECLAEQSVRWALSDILRKELNEGSHHDILEALLSGLRRNILVAEIVLDRHDFVRALTEEQLAKLFNEIGSLHGLTKLSLEFLQQPGSPICIPIISFASALGAANQCNSTLLQSLEVTGVHLQGSPQDFQHFLRVLQTKCDALLEVKFRNLTLDRDDHQFEKFLAALSDLPNIQEIFFLDANRIVHDWTMSDPSGQVALERLCQTPSLKTLCFMFPLGEEQIISMAKVLEDNTTLERLALFRCSINNNGCTALANMLERNSTLQILRLDDNCIGDIGATNLAHALCSNKSLRILDLKGNSDIHQCGYQALCHMLEYENFALMGLDTDAQTTTTRNCVDSSAASTTSTSSSLCLTDNEYDEVGNRIGFYVHLNEQARKVFLRHANNRDLFLGCFFTFRDDLDFLYYYLGANPAMCQV